MERRQKLFLSTLLSVVLAMACFLLVLAVSNDTQKSWDLTADKRHSFSDQTKDFVSGLKEPVKFYAFVDPAGSSAFIEELLTRYRKLSPRNFDFEIVDLQKDPILAEKYRVRNYGIGVLEKQTQGEDEEPRRERILKFDEASITNALTKLLRAEQKSAYFLIGHGERRPDAKEPKDLSQFRDSLRIEGYDAKTLSLAQVAAIPKDATLLVMAGPTGELLAKEQELLDDYLAGQGKLFFMVDITTPDSYVAWLEKYGFKVAHSVIIDNASAQVGAKPVTPIGLQYSPEHPITKAFASITAFALARPIETIEAQLSDRKAQLTTLVSTDKSAYLTPLQPILDGEEVSFSSEGKTPQAYPLATAGLYRDADSVQPSAIPTPAEGAAPPPAPPSARLVVASSADTFSNSYFGQAGNRDFALNAVNWLAEAENQITVRAKDPNIQPMSLPKQTQTWLYFVFCILIPFLSALTGLLIVYYRRRGGGA